MAATDFAELMSQVAERLGLHQKTIAKLGKAVGGLELSDAEAVRVADAVNVELVRIYAERHLADTMHQVAHEIVEIPDTDEDDNPIVDERTHEQIVTRRNQRDDCPDCGRTLVAARDGDSTVPVLVCYRLHGLRIGVADLTPNDIVACGVIDG